MRSRLVAALRHGRRGFLELRYAALLDRRDGALSTGESVAGSAPGLAWLAAPTCSIHFSTSADPWPDISTLASCSGELSFRPRSIIFFFNLFS